ncbi:MAG: SIS domain-containing protein [Pseudomonadota bacterium]
MDYYRIIADSFQTTIESIAMSVDELVMPIERASQLIVDCLLGEGKIIACGVGRDAALAQLFVSHLQNRFEQERPALPAMTLSSEAAAASAVANSTGFNDVYARQLRSLGKPEDILMCIHSGDGAAPLIRTLQAAHERNMSVVLLSNTQETELTSLVRAEDAALQINSDSGARTLELHLMILNTLCDLLDRQLFPSENLD